MKTIIAETGKGTKEDEMIYQTATNILKDGGLVAFPTETVYGLGANALDEAASKKIYAAKGRPSDNPLIVHIADVKDLYVLSSDVNEYALGLAEKFWPGPLTMILKKTPIVPKSITGGLSTVAIRMPSHKTAAELIKKSGIYIAAPSANISGKPSPTKAEHVINDLDGRIDMIIKDDTVDIGVESTIVDLSEGDPIILRPGYITKEMIEEALNVHVDVDPTVMGSLNMGIVPKAPGMKYKHYAPNADLTIVEGDDDAVCNIINKLAKQKVQEGFKVGIMTTEEAKDRFTFGCVKVVGSRDNELSVAHNLYALLREFDQLDMDYIYSMAFSTDNVGQAVMNRLIKAAGHTIIYA